MDPEITVILPVYRDSPVLPNLVKNLSSWRGCEIIVVADEPTEECLKTLSLLKGRAKMVVNGSRVGKVNALNQALKLSNGEILVFLDDDVEVVGDPKLPFRILEEMKDADVLDLKKEGVKRGFIGRMRYYELLGVNIGSWLLSKSIGRSPGLVGSAFAVRRSVLEKLGGFRRTVWEDVDLGVRTFINGFRFKYSSRLRVKVHTSADLKRWIAQERRGGVGAALILKEWGVHLVKAFLKSPQVFLPSLIMFLPSLLLLLSNLMTPEDALYWLVPSMTLALQFLLRFNLTFSAILGLTPLTSMLKTLIASIASFLASSAIFYRLSSKLGFQFKLHEYAAYFFLYSPLKLLVFLSGFILVFILKNHHTPDWRV